MPELSLATWANIAEIIGASGLISGLIFGLFQIRQYRSQQRDAIAINLAQTFYSKDLAHALSLLRPLHDGITLQEMQALGEEYVEAAITVTTSFETMGMLVHKRIAKLELVLDLAGGIITVMSRKLQQWQQDMRDTQQQPSWGEWFEWLADQADAVKHTKEPAHVRYRDWKP
ncbi:MAG: hypothetical protein AAGI44_16075 [Pseudomonadota bacterium]